MAFTYDPQLLKKGISYSQYLQEVEDQILHPSRDAGDLKLLPYKQKNLEIMKQLNREIELTRDFKEAILSAPKMEWLVITEGWCGDAAYILPVLAAAAEKEPNKISLKVYFRDQNLKLIDAHLTRGGRSIPKLIILNEHLDLLGSWGPRPEKLQQQIDLWKKEGMELKMLIPKTADWYRLDESRAIQEELTRVISGIKAG